VRYPLAGEEVTELDIIEAAIRRGFEIARDNAYIVTYDDPEIGWDGAGYTLETTIENMRKAASGQGAA
jgi:hypothetical protein